MAIRLPVAFGTIKISPVVWTILWAQWTVCVSPVFCVLRELKHKQPSGGTWPSLNGRLKERNKKQHTNLRFYLMNRIMFNINKSTLPSILTPTVVLRLAGGFTFIAYVESYWLLQGGLSRNNHINVRRCVLIWGTHLFASFSLPIWMHGLCMGCKTFTVKIRRDESLCLLFVFPSCSWYTSCSSFPLVLMCERVGIICGLLKCAPTVK